MERIDPTERLLRETPVPLLMEGVHREQLKQRLLAHAQSAQPRRKEMIKFAGRFSKLKVAATLAAVMILIGTGWAAEKMYQKFFTKVSVTLERSPTREWKLPDGRNLSPANGSARPLTPTTRRPLKPPNGTTRR